MQSNKITFLLSSFIEKIKYFGKIVVEFGKLISTVVFHECFEFDLK